MLSQVNTNALQDPYQINAQVHKIPQTGIWMIGCDDVVLLDITNTSWHYVSHLHQVKTFSSSHHYLSSASQHLQLITQMDQFQSILSFDAFPKISKQQLNVLSQEIDAEDARYRIQASNRVHYILILGDPEKVFDKETLCRPYLLIPELPPFPDTDWIKMQLGRNTKGDLEASISSEALQGIESWHPQNVEITTLRCIAHHKHRVQEVEFESQTAMAKIPPFEWWNPMADRETLTYEIIIKEYPADQPPIAPKFLAQLTEESRVMGFLLEKVEGRVPTAEDLPACESVVRGLHALGLVHGDINRDNFIVDETGQARMIDFEHTGLHTAEKGKKELEDLRETFSLDPAVGTTTMIVDGVRQRRGPTPYYAA